MKERNLFRWICFIFVTFFLFSSVTDGKSFGGGRGGGGFKSGGSKGAGTFGGSYGHGSSMNEPDSSRLFWNILILLSNCFLGICFFCFCSERDHPVPVDPTVNEQTQPFYQPPPPPIGYPIPPPPPIGYPIPPSTDPVPVDPTVNEQAQPFYQPPPPPMGYPIPPSTNPYARDPLDSSQIC